MNKKTLASKVQSELAIERTVLANRRTFLAYMRSAIALVVAGAGLLKFIQSTVWVFLGVACLVLTPICIMLGIYDYVCVSRLIKKEKEVLMKECYGEEDAKE